MEPSARYLFERAIPFVRPFASRFTCVLGAALLAAVLAAVEPLVVKRIFDELDGARAPMSLLQALLVLLAVLVAREGLVAYRDAGAGQIRAGVHSMVTRATVSHLHALPLSQDRESAGAIIAKMDRGINGAIVAFEDLAFNFLPSVCYLAFAFAAMFDLDVRLTLVIAAFVPVPPIIGAWAVREQAHRDRKLMERWASLLSRLNEVLSRMLLVKSCAMEDEEKNAFLAGVEQANDVTINGGIRDAGSNAAKAVAMVVARVGALGLGSWLIVRGNLTIGTLVAFLSYAGGVFAPVQGITGAYQKFRRGFVSAETVASILDAPETLTDDPDAKVAVDLRGDVEFAKVNFAYYPGHPVLQDVSFHARDGETIAIVGESGSGKTTAMKLLQRLYDPTSGSVRVDGVDLRKYEQRSLRRQVPAVLQDTELLSGTVRDNIAFGWPEATDVDVERAARAANVHEFILWLPDRYETRLGERGSRLSAGQRQRIALARALVRNPAILILEEAASSLDIDSMQILDEALALRGRTTFIIAHRLATAARADRILAFRQGRIVEAGEHNDLMAGGGYYSNLVRSHYGQFLDFPQPM